MALTMVSSVSCILPELITLPKFPIALEISDDLKPEQWKFQVFMGLPSQIQPEDDSPAKRFDMVKAAAKAFVEPFRSAIEWMPKGTYISPDRYGTWETRPWDHREGRILIAGDSAHSMTARKSERAGCSS